MVTEIQYTSINRVLDDLLDHPMLKDLTLEQVVRHAVRFISKHGYNKFYHDKVVEVEIHNFRGVLPCDIVSITQVKDLNSNICLRSMTDNFSEGFYSPEQQSYDPMNNINSLKIKSPIRESGERTFKTQGRIIYTSFPEGTILISYKSLPLDEHGFPLILDNETYLDALEAYIKMKVFTIKFDQQLISGSILTNAQTDYAVYARQLNSEMTLPSPSEMKTIAALWNTMIPKVREFDKGFKGLGDREYLRKK